MVDIYTLDKRCYRDKDDDSRIKWHLGRVLIFSSFINISINYEFALFHTKFRKCEILFLNNTLS